jgi:MerR family copper efflux transcriptional regulator
MDTLLISQVADRTGFSPSTLRYYEDIGLLPEPDRNSSGYRVYSPDDLETLRFIDRGKRLGLELDEIADILQLWRTGDCGPTRDQVEALLHAKLAQVHRDLAELQAFQQQLADAYQRVTSMPVPDVCGPECGCPPRLESPAPHHQLPVHDGGASCTLDSDQARERQAAWHQLATDALVSRDRPDDGSVVLRFAGDEATESRVRELAELEQGCCSFFDMTVTRDHDHIVLHATAPDSHRDYLDLLLDTSPTA